MKNKIAELQTNENLAILSDGAREALGEIPGLNLLLTSVNRLRRNYQLERLNSFLAASKVDNSYLEEVAHNEQTQEMFIEFTESVIQTPSKLACVTLAMIFRDPNMGSSLKSLSANALSGISQGTLNVFMAAMDHMANTTDKKNSGKWGDLLEKEKPFSVDVKQTGIVKDSAEIFAFCSDLIGRSICSKGTSIDDEGSMIGVNKFTFAIYSHMKKAREILGGDNA